MEFEGIKLGVAGIYIFAILLNQRVMRQELS